MKFRNFDELMRLVKDKPNRIVVPGANNEEVMEAIKMGLEHRIISGGILVGPRTQIEAVAAKVGVETSLFEFIDKSDPADIANTAVDMIKAGKGDFLVKGLVDTKFFMKAILRKEIGAVAEGTVLSHFVLFELPTKFSKLFAVTDAAIMIKPTLEEKAKILNNAIGVMRLLGVEKPNVSVICPVEKVNPKIQSTLDAEALVKMNREGKIANAVVEGPYDIYITFSKKLAEEKGITGGVVPGAVDIALLPDLDSANPTYKAISFFGEAMKSATILAGANFPVILPSRTDSPVTKLHSIALASFLKSQASVCV